MKRSPHSLEGSLILMVVLTKYLRKRGGSRWRVIESEVDRDTVTVTATSGSNEDIDFIQKMHAKI
jgi:hypothetical protein